MSDPETLAVYAAQAEAYASRFGKTVENPHVTAFLADIPEGGHVLDLGCGPGNAAAAMLTAGYRVEAWDASPEMAELARRTHGLEVRVASFSDLDAQGKYDGIYANFSLLHAPKSKMPDILNRIAQALKSGGILHVGLKTGKGEKRDALGRFYAYYEDAEITALLREVDLSVTARSFGEGTGLDGTVAPWIILRARKHD